MTSHQEDRNSEHSQPIGWSATILLSLLACIAATGAGITFRTMDSVWAAVAVGAALVCLIVGLMCRQLQLVYSVAVVALTWVAFGGYVLMDGLGGIDQGDGPFANLNVKELLSALPYVATVFLVFGAVCALVVAWQHCSRR